MSNSTEKKKAIERCITNSIINSLENARNNVMRHHSKTSSIKHTLAFCEKRLLEESEESSVYYSHGGKKFIVRKQYKKFLPLLYGSVLSINTYSFTGGVTFTRFLKNGEGIQLKISSEICFLGIKKKKDGKYYLSYIEEKDYLSI